MARMLQALKNLEARGERPPAVRGPLAHLADAPVDLSPGGDALTGASIAAEAAVPAEVPVAAAAEALPLVTQPFTPRQPASWLTKLAEPPIEPVPQESPAPAPPAKSDSPPPSPPPASEAPVSEPIARESLVRELPASEPIADPLPPPTRRPRDIVDKLLDRRERPAVVPAAVAERAASELETAVSRTLANPLRVAPLKQMADRLLADVRQSRSRTLLLVGVGSMSSSHEALLYNAALLAEQVGKVLIIDADTSRRTLTLGLNYGHEVGLAEALRGGEAAGRHVRPTSLAGVHFLPGGLLGESNLAQQGSRLGDILHSLSAGYGLVLVDGGRSDEGPALVWSRLCDATYFVVKLGTVEAREAQATLRDFRAGGARVLGCIAS